MGGARAMILAAGLGTRLRPLTDAAPKPLLQAGGHALIAYGLSLLRSHGLHEVVVNVHHHREQMMRALGDGSRFGMRILYSVEEHLLDSGGGIKHAEAMLADGPIVVLNSDVVSQVDLGALLRFHATRAADVTLVLRDAPNAESYGRLGIDSQGRIRRFLQYVDQSTPGEPLRLLMFASVQVIESSVIAAMPNGRSFSTTHEFYPEILRRGSALFGYDYGGPWYTADTETDLRTTDLLLSGAGQPPYMAEFPPI